MLKKLQHFRFVLFAALLIVLLTGGTGKLAPSYAATPAATQSALNLGQSYTNKDQLFSLSYPDGWVLKEDESGAINIGSDQVAVDAAFGSGNPVLKPGQVAFVVQIFVPGSALASSVNASQGGKAILTALTKPNGNKNIKFDAITDAQIGNIAASRIEFHYKDSEGVFYAFLLDKTPILIGALNAPGETVNYDDTLIAVAASITPTASTAGSQATAPATQAALDLTQSYTTQDKLYTLNYPDGWILTEVQRGLIAIGTSQTAIDAAIKSGTPALTTGQAVFEIEINPPGSPPPAVNQNGKAMLTDLVKSSSANGPKFGGITDIKVGSNGASRVEFHNPDSDGVAIAFLMGNTTILSGALSASGELATYESTLIAVSASITSTAGAEVSQATPAATLPATQVAATTEATTPQVLYLAVIAQDGSFAVNFPPDWALKDFGGDGLNVIGANTDAVLQLLLSGQGNNFNANEFAVSVRGYAGTIPDGLDTSGDLVKLVKTAVENLSNIKEHDDIKTYSVGTISTAWTVVHLKGLDATFFGFFEDKTPFIVTEYSTPNDYTDTDKVYAIIKSIKPAADAGISAADLASVDVPQVFTSPLHGGYTVHLPKSWVGATDDTIIYLASSQAALDAVAKATQTPVVKAGQVVIAIFTDGQVQGAPSFNPVDQLGNFAGRLRSPVHFGPVGSYQLGDIYAARILMTADSYDGALYMLPTGSTAQPVIVLTAPGEFAKQRTTIEAVLSSLKLTH